MKRTIIISALALSATSIASAMDFGAEVQELLASNSKILFGFDSGIGASAPESEKEGFRTEAQKPEDQIILAPGLKASYVTRNIADHADMIAFYPGTNPTHAIVCIEGEREELDGGKLNPGVQRVSLADGKVETIVRGTASCDGIRTTPWNTVLFTEEEDDGGAYEILNPLDMSEVAIVDRKTGETTDAAKVARRPALPKMAWEGLTILPDGVVFAGDELRPGTTYPNTDGGSIFKFVPAKPLAAGSNITSLDASPLTQGNTYALQVSCQKTAQVGQGCEVGAGSWIGVNPVNARIEADLKGATGYYRPEDLHQDVTFKGDGIKFCWTNTGNAAIGNYGEVMCAVDSDASTITDGKQQVAVSRFLQGNNDLNQPDNLEIHPQTGMVYVVEDNPNGDIWSCLPDGADADQMSDGCTKMLSVKDSSAEPTGFIFSPDGKTAYFNIQHSSDKAMPKVDGYGTDDMIAISGFGQIDLAAK